MANDTVVVTRIVVAGIDANGQGYVLDNLSMKDSPAQWGKAVVRAFDR